MMLAAEVHLDIKNYDYQMERYVFKRSNDGISQFTFSYLTFLFCWFFLARVLVFLDNEYMAIDFDFDFDFGFDFDIADFDSSLSLIQTLSSRAQARA
jgi:hypothetical protein